jgi:DNA-binding Lrp family transcriptional regulator
LSSQIERAGIDEENTSGGGVSPDKLGKAQVVLDGTDRAILAALLADGRMTNAALAARVGIAESTCAYRVRALQAAGVIRAISARLDLGALGYPIQAIVKVRLGRHDRKHVLDLYDQLVQVPGALAVFHVAGEDDFHMHVAVESPEKLRDLVLEHVTIHPVVRQTETHLVFDVRDGRGVLDEADSRPRSRSRR